jgi:bacterioferritin B
MAKKTSFHDALNEHIAREFAAEQQYIAIAVYFDDLTLPQLAGHFYRQALEERNHAMMMVRYLLDRNKVVTIPGVDAPKTAFEDAVEPVALALAQEQTVTRQISALMGLARGESDYVAEEFLQWFLKEQLEEESSMSDLLDTVKRAKETNILLAESFLAREQVGDSGKGDVLAPGAAGGAV